MSNAPLNPDAIAFPIPGGELSAPTYGITVREYMATQILAGLASNGKATTTSSAIVGDHIGTIAAIAVALTDDLIEALNAPEVTP